MNALFDIFLVILFIICVAMGYKNGFVKTIMGVVSFAVSFIMAVMFSPQLSEFLYAKYIKPTFIDEVTKDLASIIGKGVENLSLEKLLDELPKDFVKILTSYGSNTSEVREWIDNAAVNGIENINGFVTNNLVSPIAKNIAYVIAFAIIFAAAMILCRILTAVLNGIVKFPGLNFLNRMAGLLLGILYGLTWGYAFVFLISLVLPYFSARGWINSAPSLINSTVFFKWMHENPPFDLYKNIM